MDDQWAQLWAFLDKHRDEASTTQLLHRALTGECDLEVNSALIHAITDQLGSDCFGTWISPPGITNFIAELAAEGKPTSVLDPMCGYGSMLRTVAERTQATTVHGVEVNVDAAKIADRVVGHLGAVLAGDVFTGSPPPSNAYDLIVAEPPFLSKLLIPYQFNRDGLTLESRHGDEAAVCLACSHLTDSGRVIMLVRATMLWSNRSRLVREAIKSLGCAVRICIRLPRGSLPKTGIEPYIILIERGQQDQVFVGEYTDDHDHQRVLLENLRAHRAGKQPAQGRLCEWEDFRGYRALDDAETAAVVAHAVGYEAVPMRELVLETRRTSRRNFERLEHQPNCVYLPCVGRGEATTSQEDLSEKLKDYVQLRIDPNLAEARFVVQSINGLFRMVLDGIRTGTVVDRIRVDDLLTTDFYLPPLDTQKKIIAAVQRISVIRAEADELESALWVKANEVDALVRQVETINKNKENSQNEEDRLVAWMDTLPFPVASILWRSRSVAGTTRERYEILIHFFEALAEFLATVHLSAFASDRNTWLEHAKGLQKALSKQNLTLERASFGTWKCVVEYLGSRCRKLMNTASEACETLYRTRNPHVLSMLTSAEMLQILQSANQIRNTWQGHAGAIGERKAEEVHDELLDLVQKCRGVMGRTWSNYELVRPSDCRFRGGMYHYKVQRIMGTRTPFEMVERKSIEGLEDSALYLLDANGDRGLRLLPFVRMLQSPRTEANACYFFSRRQGDGFRYVSYHHAEDSDLTDQFPDTSEMLLRLGISTGMGGD